MRGDWLVRSLSNEPETLNPILAHDAYESIINSYGGIMESLVDRDNADPDIYLPVLAATWEESPDHLEYTFPLRRGVTWHDGSPSWETSIGKRTSPWSHRTVTRPNGCSLA